MNFLLFKRIDLRLFTFFYILILIINGYVTHFKSRYNFIFYIWLLYGRIFTPLKMMFEFDERLLRLPCYNYYCDYICFFDFDYVYDMSL